MMIIGPGMNIEAIKTMANAINMRILMFFPADFYPEDYNIFKPEKQQNFAQDDFQTSKLRSTA